MFQKHPPLNGFTPGLFPLAWLLGASLAFSQTTALTVQGSLKDGGTAANGVYDFEFRLFDGANAQQGSTQAKDDLQVTDGLFTVELDFGDQFPGAGRFLEISVRAG